jgi:threonine dehydrogenase-like Zn-dependent dehydrogenase
MRALTYHGVHDVRVDNVPDPVIEEPTDAIIRVTSSGICGSDPHRRDGHTDRAAPRRGTGARWIDDITPLLEGDDDPLGVDDFATHHVPLDDAPKAYETFQKKQDNAFKVLLKP